MSKPTKAGAPAQRTTTIVTRAGKGAPLTWDEHDANHVNAAATADQALAMANTGGTGDAQDIPYATAVPLDKPGFGKRMALHTLVGNETLTQAAGAVQDGNCAIYLQQDATGGRMVTLPTPWLNKGSDALDATANAVSELLVTSQLAATLYAWVKLGAGAPPMDMTPPSEVSATVANAAPTIIEVLLDEDLDQSLNATTWFSAFAVSAGHALTASAWGNTVRKLNLTTSTAFVNGEAATTLAFTQSGSIGLQDAAGNKVASFSAKPITNNVAIAGDVTPPTLVSPAVDTSTPTHIQLPWSEPMSSTISPASAFAVSGHTVTDHQMWNSTLTYLVLSAPFVVGESGAVSYTQPGTNAMADLAGNKAANFSGVAISNGLVAGGATTLFADNFNRADGPIGTSSHGDVWIAESSGTSGALMPLISNNKLKIASDYSYCSLLCPSDVYTVSVDWTPNIPTLSDGNANVSVRALSNEFNERDIVYFHNTGAGGTIRIAHHIYDGTLSNVWDSSSVTPPAYDITGATTYNVKLKVTATTLELFVNGTSVSGPLASTPVPGGQFGVALEFNVAGAPGPAADIFDNFLVTTP
jgi:hypothetical protein